MLYFAILFVLPAFCLSAFSKDLKFINNSPYTSLIERDFRIFTNWVDCKERMSVLFHYIAEKDFGNYPRSSTYRLDPNVTLTCQQKTYSSYGGSSGYDRGHMVPANHVDHDLTAIKECNYMTNINPQASVLNQQAWLHAEEIVECWRDITTLRTFGGIIMGDNATNDIFIQSHGIRTPDWYWRVVVKESDNDIIAWIMPNDATATRSKIDTYLTTLKTIETKTGFTFTQFTTAQKTKKQNVSWIIPANCDKSLKSNIDVNFEN